MSNPQRNSITTPFGFDMRATFEVIAEVENYFDMSYLKLVEYWDQDLRIADLVRVIKLGTKGAGNELSDERINSIFEENGFIGVKKEIEPFLQIVFFGVPKSKKK